MYSLSTCWNSHRHIDGKAMLEEIRDLGFDTAELSHGTRISLMPGILEAVDSGLIRISSLHNFCPLPMGVIVAAPNVFRFSAENEQERNNAYKHTLKTLDFAVRVRASLVVLHLGSIEIKPYTDRLVALIEQGQKETPRYQKLFEEAIRKREAKKERFVNNATALLERLVPEAESRGILLGVENREAVEEIPLESDLSLFFSQFRQPTIRYWHDTGHAQIKENLGFISHAMHLENFAERLAGFHIHDVQFPGRDHRAPGTGTIDFAALKPYVKPEHLKVFEFSPSLTPEEAKAGIAHIKNLWGEG